jgi:hypothetical protein
MPCEAKRISAHEQGSKHMKNLERYDRQKQAAATDSDSSSDTPSLPGPSGNARLPPERVLGPLARTLEQMAQNVALHQPLQNFPADIGGVNWDTADYDTQLEDLREVQMTMLAQNFVNQLQDDDNGYDSNDDPEERSQINTSSDSDSGKVQFFVYMFSTYNISDFDVPYVAGRKTRRLDPNAVKSPWFPWPDKEVKFKLNKVALG